MISYSSADAEKLLAEISMWDQIGPKLREGETIRQADARGAFTDAERQFIRKFAIEHCEDL